ncbi:MAG: ferritin family protein [Candidatus Zixiibacteriota bacterium]
MTESKTRITEVLKMAIKSEDDGFQFYNLLAQKTTNMDAKKKLENLRDDEVRHKKTLINIFHKYIGNEIGQLPAKGINALAEVFQKGQLEEKKSEMDFINLAIEAELSATNYYHQERNLIDDPLFQAIFDQLAEEEHRHYELLMSEKEALSGNYYWFEYDDTSPMEH